MGENINCRGEINIKGIVEEIGFRPFLYNLTKNYELLGFPLNDTTSMFVIICTNYGPGFTIVKGIPYGRRFTAMSLEPGHQTIGMLGAV